MGSDPAIIQPVPADIPALARLWHQGWHDGHADVVPATLSSLRTLDSFAHRLADMLETTRIARSGGDILGFCAVRDAEIYQLFVAPAARGTSVARSLLNDGEARIGASGHDIAVLDCAIGNERAAQFYRKCGWHLSGERETTLDTVEGPFPLITWHFQKALR